MRVLFCGLAMLLIVAGSPLAQDLTLSCEAPAAPVETVVDHPCDHPDAPPWADLGEFPPASFTEFLGIRYGDSVDAAKAILGFPQGLAERPGKTTYFGYADASLRVGFNPTTRVIQNIRVTGAHGVAALQARGIVDERLKMIGTPKDRVVEKYGAPTDAHDDYYVYSFGGRSSASGDVILYCPRSDRYVCSEITVQWDVGAR